MLNKKPRGLISLLMIIAMVSMYSVPLTSFADAKDKGETYSRATKVDAGSTYVIVAKSDTKYYALTNRDCPGENGTKYLVGQEVDASGNAVDLDDVKDDMKWEFTSASEDKYNLINLII